ncbi:ras-related and estrogen-regulated growth inhibitor-like [Homarus americanus]|uniref:ras-related and estrogen-regulated growth inhibitor-like n=1 Tax=Homarus americanus TaxID=6706 RepID=UPI001C46F260|nr:ras-related and estrogen-regulated growth inhibitor-like [Homarus americanus]
MCRNQPQTQSGDKMRSEERDKVPSSPGGREGRPRHQQLPRLRIVVLGAEGVGKSALTVRYLTRRYISEYRRAIDLLYRHTVSLDDVTSDVEILDVSLRQHENEGVSSSHTRWGEGFVVVYSVDDSASFHEAAAILDALQRLKAPVYVPVILLANKRDLDPGRQVSVEEGQALSLQQGCQFYEVSAAESHVGVTLAFQALLRETRSLQLTRPLPRQRRISIVAVSRMIGSLIGRGPDPPSPTLKPTVIVKESAGKRTLRRKDKKRPSLSL